MSIENDFETTKQYDKRDYFDFNIVNFLFLCGGIDAPHKTSYGVHISQLVLLFLNL